MLEAACDVFYPHTREKAADDLRSWVFSLFPAKLAVFITAPAHQPRFCIDTQAVQGATAYATESLTELLRPVDKSLALITGATTNPPAVVAKHQHIVGRGLAGASEFRKFWWCRVTDVLLVIELTSA